MIFYFESTKMPLRIKPIFTRAEGQKQGTSHVKKDVRIHSIKNWSQQRTRDGIRDAPCQERLLDEEGTDDFPHAVSRFMITTDVDSPSLDHDLHDGGEMKEHWDLRGCWKGWQRSSRCFRPGVFSGLEAICHPVGYLTGEKFLQQCTIVNGALMEVLPTGKVADGIHRKYF